MEKEEYRKIATKINGLQEKEKNLIIKSMPKFDRGVAEAALEREGKVWKDLEVVFNKHSIKPSVITSILSDNQPSVDPNRPDLVCAGVKVTLQYLVSPMDKIGKDGSMPNDVIEEVAKIRQEIEKLTRSLEMV